jgi:NADH-quinone oxidoreductase subunit L
VSQLGYMFLAMGVGAYAAGIFHLMTHAFFKALPVPRVGQRHPRHGRRAGHATDGRAAQEAAGHVTTFIIATLAIAGIPPLAGFFSKDEILWQAFSSPLGSRRCWAGGIVGRVLTAFYMFRQVFMVFFGRVPRRTTRCSTTCTSRRRR